MTLTCPSATARSRRALCVARASRRPSVATSSSDRARDHAERARRGARTAPPPWRWRRPCAGSCLAARRAGQRDARLDGGERGARRTPARPPPGRGTGCARSRSTRLPSTSAERGLAPGRSPGRSQRSRAAGTTSVPASLRRPPPGLEARSPTSRSVASTGRARSRARRGARRTRGPASGSCAAATAAPCPTASSRAVGGERDLHGRAFRRRRSSETEEEEGSVVIVVVSAVGFAESGSCRYAEVVAAAKDLRRRSTDVETSPGVRARDCTDGRGRTRWVFGAPDGRRGSTAANAQARGRNPSATAHAASPGSPPECDGATAANPRPDRRRPLRRGPWGLRGPGSPPLSGAGPRAGWMSAGEARVRRALGLRPCGSA